MSDLVLIAAPQEATYLPDDVHHELIGIGLVPAAVATTRLILEHRPTRVVNLGSVGSLDHAVTGIVYPSAVVNRDINVDELAAAGLSLPHRIELDGDGPVLGSGDSFVASDAARTALMAHCSIVDMEGFAVAWACRELGVELVMVKHVSDAADEGALEWKQLVDISARALAEEYERIRG